MIKISTTLRGLLLGAVCLASPDRGAQPNHPARRHYIVRFTGSEAGVRERLAGHGMTVVGRAGPKAFVVTSRGAAELVAAGVTGAEAFEPAGKLSPLMAEAAGGYVVEFHPDTVREQVRTLLEDAGWQVLDNAYLLPHQLLIIGDPARLTDLAAWDSVAYVFPASSDLMQGNPVAACAGALIGDDTVGQYVKVGSGWGGAGPDGVVELRYGFASHSDKLPVSTVETEVGRAFAEWARYGKLRFLPSADTAAARTIAVLFARASHGDPYPFDGPGKILAHTFYPVPINREPIAGDMHLDDDEGWNVGSTVDLFSVALHEAGHALGLGHSDRPGTVMYPYYRMVTGLSDDDIAAIRDLYGSGDTPVPANPPVAADLSLAIDLPASAAVNTPAAALPLAGRTQGGTGTVQVTWRNDRGGSGTAAGSTSWSVPSVALSPGQNIVTVSAADTSGHAVSQSVTATREAANAPPAAPDSLPPALRIGYPSFTITAVSQAKIVLRGTASDNVGVAAVRWTNSTGSSGDAAGTQSWSAEVPLLEGTNNITVRAYDSAGNSSWRAVTVIRRQ